MAGYYISPIGLIKVLSTLEHITWIGMVDKKIEEEAISLELEAVRQLEAYFLGSLKEFSLPLDFGKITPFKHKIYQLLEQIPYGQRISYGELASLANHAGAARAVGSVMANNPISFIMPCHRVVTSTGSMGGYAWSVEKKEWLLKHEELHAKQA